MEGHQQNSPQAGYLIDSDDAKYVSGLSTILVATIQDAKDRISQIEYIFCSQLFPKFQSNSKSLQKIYSDARKTAEDAWKKKENNLLFQLEKLKLENLQALEENQSLKLKKAEPSKEQEEYMNLLLAKQKGLEKKVGELEWELRQKSKEVDEGMELQNKLLQLVQSKTSVIMNKGKQLKECEEKTNVLLAKLNCLENKVDELEEELRGKTIEVAKGKELQEDLIKKFELQASKIKNSEQSLIDHEEEKKLLTANLERLEENVDGLQKELRKKTEEVEEERKLQEKLIQQIDMNGSEMLKYAKQLEEHEKEKKLLLVKLKGLEEKVEELQVDLRERSGEVAERKESYEKLLQCNELKALELVSEKNDKRDIIASYERQLSRLVTGKNEKRDLLVSYKRLKSENNYLRKKLGLTLEDKIPQNEVEEETNSLRHHWNQSTSPDIKNNNPDTSVESRDTNKLKNEIIFQEKLDDEKGVELIRTSTSRSPSFSSPGTSKFTSESKSAPLAGMKRPASHWRDTRSRQCQDGPDPHDDFLDTPLENIRGNLSKAIKEEVHDLPVRVPQDMNFDSSDDETQDMNVAPSPQRQQMPVPKPNTRSYKYVEPVRKKAERENLVGIECKQCKKFYDAVLPDGGGKDTDGNNRNFRCEHHDGVSRHRYRYVPPSTPEGFWNIGFDSEM